MAKKAIDWERIELQYRAGVLTLREMGTAHGVAESAIRKRAKRDGWSRDLAAKVRTKAEALVRKNEVRKEVRTDERISEQREIAIEAEVVAQIKISQRSDIGRARTLAMTLLEELEAQTGHRELLAELGEMLHGAEEGGISDKMMSVYHAVTSLPGRTKTMKDLGDTLYKLIGLEREAYDIAPPKQEMEHKGGITVHMGCDDAAL